MIKNDRSKQAPQLKKGDKVYLLTKNLRTTKSSRKLDHVKVGPFLIEEQKGPVNYRLRLPKDAKIHPVFHISLLEPADPETPCQETFYFEKEEEDEFEVEKILEQKGQDYLVKWKGYPDSENTWEPRTNLMNCQLLLRKFHQSNDRQKKGQAKKDHPEEERSQSTTQEGAGKPRRSRKVRPQAPEESRKDSRIPRKEALGGQ